MDLIKRQKFEDGWLCEPSISTYVKQQWVGTLVNDLHAAKKFYSYLSFENLLKLTADFDIRKLSNMLRQESPQFEIYFWQRFKNNQLSPLLLPSLDILHFESTDRDTAFVKMFKVYAGIYIRDHCNHFSITNFRWLRDIYVNG